MIIDWPKSTYLDWLVLWVNISAGRMFRIESLLFNYYTGILVMLIRSKQPPAAVANNPLLKVACTVRRVPPQIVMYDGRYNDAIKRSRNDSGR